MLFLLEWCPLLPPCLVCLVLLACSKGPEDKAGHLGAQDSSKGAYECISWLLTGHVLTAVLFFFHITESQGLQIEETWRKPFSSTYSSERQSSPCRYFVCRIRKHPGGVVCCHTWMQCTVWLLVTQSVCTELELLLLSASLPAKAFFVSQASSCFLEDLPNEDSASGGMQQTCSKASCGRCPWDEPDLILWASCKGMIRELIYAATKTPALP